MHSAPLLLLLVVAPSAWGGDTSTPNPIAGSPAPSGGSSAPEDVAGMGVFRFRDTQTGTIWNVTSVAESGPLVGRRLTRVPAYSAYWVRLGLLLAANGRP